jgi:hypothetical protein
VNEAAADVDGTKSGHVRKAALNTDEDDSQNADASDAADSTKVASAPEPDHHDLIAPEHHEEPAAPAVSTTAMSTTVAPASAPNGTAGHAPTPKTIDIP